MSELEITENVLQHVAEQIGETMTPEQVSTVLAAFNAVQGGAELGTVVRDPQTGAIAHRVSDNGVRLWRVSAPDGGVWNDMQPTILNWTTIYSPE